MKSIFKRFIKNKDKNKRFNRFKLFLEKKKLLNLKYRKGFRFNYRLLPFFSNNYILEKANSNYNWRSNTIMVKRKLYNNLSKFYKKKKKDHLIV